MEDMIMAYASSVRAMLDAFPYREVVRAAEVLAECHARGSTVFIAGNGGSASTASHFACDLAKRTRRQGVARFRVVALTDSVPLITAWGNDVDFEQVFAEQLIGLLRAHDVLVLISASGNSPNVLVAARAARDAGAVIIVLTGPTGGGVATLADVSVRVPGGRAEAVEDGHSVVSHALCAALRGRLHEGAAENGE